MLENLSHVLSMGKYTAYIWTAYGIAAFMLLLHIRSVRLQRQKHLSAIGRWFQREV